MILFHYRVFFRWGRALGLFLLGAWFSSWYVVSIYTAHTAQRPQSGPRWSPAFKIEPVLFPPSLQLEKTSERQGHIHTPGCPRKSQCPGLKFQEKEAQVGVLISCPQSLSCVQLFVIPWTAGCQASLSFTISQSLLKFMSFESVMPSNHLTLVLPSIFPSIRVFSNESALHIRQPKDWSFSFSISPSNEYSELISFGIDWFDLAVQGTLKNLL